MKIQVMAQIQSSNHWKFFADHLGSTLNTDELNDVTFSFNEAQHIEIELKEDNGSKTTEVKANRGLLSLLSSKFRCVTYATFVL